MTFTNTVLEYRIALNTQTQVFMAIDALNPEKVGYGVTIEQAIHELKNIA